MSNLREDYVQLLNSTFRHLNCWIFLNGWSRYENCIENGIFFLILGNLTDAARSYFGAHLGPLSSLHHGVSGDVYAVDSRTLYIKNFNYDGEGPGNKSFRNFYNFSFLNDYRCLNRWQIRFSNYYYNWQMPHTKVELIFIVVKWKMI